MPGDPVLYFRAAVASVLVEKAAAPAAEKLDELERKVADALGKKFEEVRERIRASVRKYLEDRGGNPTDVDVSNLLRTVERELAGEDSEWILFVLPLMTLFARSVYDAIRSRGDQEWTADQLDAALENALAAEQEKYLRAFYERRIEPSLRPALETALAGAGSAGEAAAALEKALNDRLGDEQKPASYLLLLLAVARTRGAAMGEVAALLGEGAELYQLVATLDERTTEICRYLDQRVFRVADALPALEAYGRGESTSTWLSFEDILSLGAGEDRENPEENAALTEGGILLPPFHGNCRTVVRRYQPE